MKFALRTSLILTCSFFSACSNDTFRSLATYRDAPPDSGNNPPVSDIFLVPSPTPSVCLPSSPIAKAPEAPRFLSARTAENGQVSLTWYAPEVGASPIQYSVYRSTTSNPVSSGSVLIITPALSFVDSTVTNGTSYYYQVVAQNSLGTSPLSNEAVAIPIFPSAVADLSNTFVDFAASSGGNGSYNAPFNNLSTAVSQTLSGGTINIFDGTKTMTNWITLTKPVTIRSLTGDFRNSDVVLTGPYPTQAAAFHINANVHNVIIKGLELENYAHAQGLVSLTNVSGQPSPSNNLKLLQNYFHDIFSYVLNRNGYPSGNNWTIYGNKIENINGSLMSALNLWSNPGANAIVSHNEINQVGFAGIQIDTTTDLEISYNKISNTGSAGIQIANASGNITLKRNTITSTNLNFESDGGAVVLYRPENLVGNITVQENALSQSYNGISIRNGGDVTSKSIQIFSNTILTNSNRGFYHGGSGQVNAQQNYWNACTGPTHSSNPSGTGERVDSLVLFLPFLSSSP